MSAISTKPYLIRAIHEWCIDSGYRPYIAVAVDEHTIVPREFVRAGEIVLNVSPAATNRLSLGNDLIEFEARFGGVARTVSIPIDNVSAIYAQETGQGMAFEVPKPLALVPEDGADEPDALVAGGGTEPGVAEAGDEPPAARPRSRRPKLSAVPSPAEAEAGPEAAVAADGDAPAAKAPRRRRKPAAKAEAPEGAAVEPLAAPADAATPPDDDPPAAPPPKGRPRLTRVK